ncbi:hypothetical protein WK80_20925 [Burkholderia multivorans]|nr:hypothetical protein Bmul_5844 [Burkholderia multivorans ATCC 17616]KVV22998.1 hypothetical protein WK80_20925 [Burkholderia multivorans]PRF39006.1 hypothetical protein C6Q10_14485 [Burkholderia multivorans]PRF49036.1 hypothetical protein C6Q04_10325 [Burkholderia multivorans]PRF53763.1 hypothetical protein C6Q28_25220 [Burkholderia multivorans]
MRDPFWLANGLRPRALVQFCRPPSAERRAPSAERRAPSAERRAPTAVRSGFPNGKAARERWGFLRQAKARPARRHEAHTFSA